MLFFLKKKIAKKKKKKHRGKKGCQVLNSVFNSLGRNMVIGNSRNSNTDTIIKEDDVMNIWGIA